MFTVTNCSPVVTSWCKPASWGFHMAHLCSTSSSALYLALGGVLALSPGQCMLGWGVVTSNDPPTTPSLTHTPLHPQCLLPTFLHYLAQGSSVTGTVTEQNWELTLASQLMRQLRAPLHAVVPLRQSPWITAAPTPRDGGMTANTRRPAGAAAVRPGWSTPTWRRLRRWCA